MLDSFRLFEPTFLVACLKIWSRFLFQAYPQPEKNPAFPLTGQYPNQYLRLAPRFGLAWQPDSKTVVRGGFGQFYTNMNGLNYRNAVASNGVPSQQASASVSYGASVPNQQTPTFPNILPGNPPLFAASPDISLVSPQFHVPYILQASLQIQREIFENTTLTIGNHVESRCASVFGQRLRLKSATLTRHDDLHRLSSRDDNRPLHRTDDHPTEHG